MFYNAEALFLKRLLYTLLDLITLKKGVSRKINKIKVRFPARYSRYYNKNYETDNYLFLQQELEAGMQVIDIGAHIGLFSVCCSKLTGPGGRIICFEPTPGTFSILKDTLRLNHCSNVIARQAAVGSKKGTATFYVNHTAGCNSNSLVRNTSGKDQFPCEVVLVTIDSIVAEYEMCPSLIKIDAEGAELDVLKGGIKTFKDHRPKLILGLHPVFIKQKGDSLEAIFDLLSESGYRISMAGKLLTKQDFCNHFLLFDVHCFPLSGEYL